MTWTKRAESAHVLNDVAWSWSTTVARIAVAVGDSGTILTSPDGLTWTARTSGTFRDLQAVAWTGTQWVAAGEFGPVLTSADGILWQVQPLQSNQRLNSLASSAEVMVLTGAQGSVRTSTDGVTWTLRSTGTQADLYQVIHAREQFLIVASNGVLMTSPDGITWTQRNVGTPNALVVAASGLGGWVVLSGPGNVYISRDAVTWTLSCEECLAPSGWTGLVDDLIWTGSEFVGVGGATFTSPNGSDWRRRTDVDESAWQTAVTYTGSLLIGVGLDGIRTSP